MTPEKEQELYDKYPELFQDRTLPSSQSLMCFGCEHSDGWHGILSILCFLIKQHERNIEGQTKYKQKTDPEYQLDYTPVRFCQIKEKYGGLTVHYDGGDEYVHGLVSMAEGMSYQICEECGNRGEPNKEGWIKTTCKLHIGFCGIPYSCGKEYNMTFDEWLNGIEGFGLRVERIHDDLVVNREVRWADIKQWLEAAYNAGYDHREFPPSGT